MSIERQQPHASLLCILEDLVDVQHLAVRLNDQQSSASGLTPAVLRHTRDLRAAFHLIQDRVQSVLNDHDVQPFGALRGEAVDLHAHEVIGRIVENDPVGHGRVHTLLEPGARIGSDGPVLRRALVSVSVRPSLSAE